MSSKGKAEYSGVMAQQSGVMQIMASNVKAQCRQDMQGYGVARYCRARKSKGVAKLGYEWLCQAKVMYGSVWQSTSMFINYSFQEDKQYGKDKHEAAY